MENVLPERRIFAKLKKVIHIFSTYPQILPQFDTKRTFVIKKTEQEIHKKNIFVDFLFLFKNPLTNAVQFCIMQWYFSDAPLAKLDIASVYGTEGQEFESLTVHQTTAEKPQSFSFLF